MSKLSARDAGSHFEWQNQWRLVWQKTEFHLFLAICIGISLNLAGMLTTEQQTIIYLKVSYAAVHLLQSQ